MSAVNKGPEQTYFPYGNEYERSKCWYDYYGNDQEALPSGSKPECTNSYGAFDMVGNVSEYAINDIALAELTEPEHVGPMIAFLASGLADHATGCTIDINAGSYVH